MSLEYSYNTETDIITIEGVKYSSGLFKKLAFPTPVGEWFRVEANKDCIIEISTKRNFIDEIKLAASKGYDRAEALINDGNVTECGSKNTQKKIK